jgi:hypothetical protein
MSTNLSPAKRGWSVGLTAMAGFFLLMAGGFQLLQGLAALIHGDFFVVVQNNTYSLNVTGWGWIHLIIGIIGIITGFALLAGQTWARVVGIVLAVLSAIANFMFLPYYPVWSILIILLDVAVIWALTVYQRDSEF